MPAVQLWFGDRPEDQPDDRGCDGPEYLGVVKLSGMDGEVRVVERELGGSGQMVRRRLSVSDARHFGGRL
jgi:hypothetical protein